MFPHGALLFASRPEPTLTRAFHEAVAGLGYEVVEAAEAGASPTSTFASELGDAAGLVVELPKNLAVALGRNIASRLSVDVRVFTVTVLEPAGRSFECVVDELTLSASGVARPGTWAADLAERYAHDWSAVSDGKAYFAARVLLQEAARLVLLHGVERPGRALREPATLGSARLDALAAAIRACDRVQVTQAAGRECVRVTTDDASVLSFVDAAELATLRAKGLVPA